VRHSWQISTRGSEISPTFRRGFRARSAFMSRLRALLPMGLALRAGTTQMLRPLQSTHPLQRGDDLPRPLRDLIVA
jgi:hypothetical protein